MSNDRLITKLSQVISRYDGSEVRIVAQVMFGIGLQQSIDVYVLKRESKEHQWSLCDSRPHPESKDMSVDEYVKRGRSEMLQAVTHAEILKLTSMLGKPMSLLEPHTL